MEREKGTSGWTDRENGYGLVKYGSVFNFTSDCIGIFGSVLLDHGACRQALVCISNAFGFAGNLYSDYVHNNGSQPISGRNRACALFCRGCVQLYILALDALPLFSEENEIEIQNIAGVDSISSCNVLYHNFHAGGRSGCKSADGNYALAA